MYLTVKALHLISMVAWFAALFYLPRLYVYHCKASIGSELDQTLQIMERRLLKAIMTPAMVSTWVFGLILLFVYRPDVVSDGWIHVKLLLIVILSGYHGFLSKARKGFVAGANKRSEKFYRLINEVPTVILIAVVFLAVLKPF
jgi:putative membrane protein